MTARMVSLGVGAFALLALAAVPQQAEAALNLCPASHFSDPTSKVVSGGATAVSNCQYITPADSSNVASITNINAAGFFGFSDWVSNGQDQMGGAGSTGGSGTWSIVGAAFASRDYIIVFKDGSNTNLVGFLFNETSTSGTWTTPFTEPPFSFPGAATQRDVSHITIAYRTTGGPNPGPVPEPATLGLLGMGLVGLGALARRRRRA